jgi:hypothetical protein
MISLERESVGTRVGRLVTVGSVLELPMSLSTGSMDDARDEEEAGGY